MKMDNVLPIAKKVQAKTIAQDLISFRHNETYENAIRRYLIEKRKEKLKKIFGDELYE